MHADLDQAKGKSGWMMLTALPVTLNSSRAPIILIWGKLVVHMLRTFQFIAQMP